MKRFFQIVMMVALTVLAASCSRYSDETVKGDPTGARIYTLDNGLKIYTIVNKDEPRIDAHIAVKVGSKNDPQETTGLAHYFEHLMFKGTKQFGTQDYAAEEPLLDQIEALFEVYRKTEDPAERKAIYHQNDSISYEASKIAIPNEYDKLMSAIGADGTNAYTSYDVTCYTENIPSNQIETWAKIQADRFENCVLRGFHTELETIYEEYNMGATQDQRKIINAVTGALFQNHTYHTPVIGWGEHLKNPSITNVKKYHDTYYVPNNIAICVAGDFNPKEMVAAIEKYFGDWEPNPDIPKLQFEPEAPITEPIVKEVYGLEAENLALSWRLPAPSDLKTAAVAEIAGAVLYNGQAGLMDLDVNQLQKALYVYGGYEAQADYSYFLALGAPKQGQTLEQVRDLALEEVAKLRSGDFDEALLEATVNNIKLNKMRQLEDNTSRAQNYVTAFINGIPWKDACKDIERMEAVTKEDVVAFANEYLGENAYAVVYKRQGEDTSVQKIAAPKITPIVTNRDQTSAFLTEIQNSEVKPIEPVFVDFDKDMAKFTLAEGAEVLYKKNDLNDVFNLQLVYNKGTQQDPALGLAMNYLSYLGTPDMSAEEMASKMYALACSYSGGAGSTSSSIRVSGLSENMAEALRLVENLVQNAVPDETILANLKADMIKDRADSKQAQRSCFSALQRYIYYGPDFIKATTLTNDALMALTSEQLLGKVREVFNLGHEILYYGPMSESELKSSLADAHYVAEGAQILPEQYPTELLTPTNRVVMAQYDAAQIYYLQVSNRGEAYDVANAGDIAMYNEYFGGGMNTVVFQEMREARGLAYSAQAYLNEPSFKDDTYSFMAFIATQNDKMRQAVEAFDEIINNMPESEASFAVAKEALLSRLRTQRTTGMDVLRSYLTYRRLGLSEPDTKAIFETAQKATLADVVATQQKWVKDRNYTYAILGDIKDLDTKFLSTLGPVQTLSLEEIIGY